MIRTLTIAEAQADFPRLVDAARNGDEIIIRAEDVRGLPRAYFRI